MEAVSMQLPAHGRAQATRGACHQYNSFCSILSIAFDFFAAAKVHAISDLVNARKSGKGEFNVW
jgi:hypothetical protein